MDALSKYKVPASVTEATPWYKAKNDTLLYLILASRRRISAYSIRQLVNL